MSMTKPVETMAEPWDDFEGVAPLALAPPAATPIVPNTSIAGRSLAAVVALTLTGSWIASVYILPALTVWLFGRGQVAESQPASPPRLQRLYAIALRAARESSGCS